MRTLRIATSAQERGQQRIMNVTISLSITTESYKNNITESLFCVASEKVSWDIGNPTTIVHAMLVFTLAINVISFPIALTTNYLFIYSVRTKPNIWRSSDLTLICSLTVANILTAAILQPLFIVRVNLQTFSREKNCVVDAFFFVGFRILYCASLLHILYVSFQRFLAVENPFLYNSHAGTKKQILGITVIWFVSIAMGASQIFDVIRTAATYLLVLIALFVFGTVSYFYTVMGKTALGHQLQIHTSMIKHPTNNMALSTRTTHTLRTTARIIGSVWLFYFPYSVLIALVELNVNFDKNVLFIVHIVVISFALLGSMSSGFNYAWRKEQIPVCVFKVFGEIRTKFSLAHDQLGSPNEQFV